MSMDLIRSQQLSTSHQSADEILQFHGQQMNVCMG